MERSYYDKMKRLEDLTTLSADKRETFFQQLLIVCSGILGVIVALYKTQTECLYIRLVFVFSVVLFALCILSLLLVLYDHTKIVERIRLTYLDELQKAIQNNREVQELITVEEKKRTLFFEKCSLILFVLGLFSLTLYALFINLY